MTRFSAHNQSSATLKSSRKEVWDVLTDAKLLPKLTPYLHTIDVDGDRWRWNVAKVPLLGRSIGTTFTEVMTFEKPTHIGFAHDPARTDERTGVDGNYELTPLGTGTRVAIDLEIWCDLPLPRLSRIAVETVMHGVVAAMGRRFAANMLRHLGE